MRNKGQVQLVIVAVIIGLILLIPSLLVFGVQPSTDLGDQVADNEPFMKATHISSNLEQTFIPDTKESAFEKAASEIIKQPLVEEDYGEIRERFEEKASDHLNEQLNRLESEGSCEVSSNPDISARIKNFSDEEVCGLKAEFLNEGDPVTVSCSGETSAYEKKVSLDSYERLEDFNTYFLLNTAYRIINNQGYWERYRREEVELLEIQADATGFFSEERCYQEFNIELEDVGSHVWVNVTQPHKEVFSPEGYKNHSVSVKHFVK